MSRDESGIGPSFRPWPERRGPESDFLDWNLWGSWPRLFRRAGEPTIDMYETENEVVVEADVPGYDPDNLKVRVTPQALTMRGRLESRRDEDRDGYFLRERGYGEFSRTVRFPTEVRASEAKASYRDGVLRVTAPKLRESAADAKEVPIEREQ